MKHPNAKPVVARGWVRTVRRSKARAFVEVTDGSSLPAIQVVIDGPAGAALATGCAVEVQGNLVEHHSKPINEIQSTPEQVSVLGAVDTASYPLQKKHHSLEFLREIPHLRPRSNTITAATRVRHVMAATVSSWLDQQGYLQVHTPVITSSDCEGAGETFAVSPSPTNQGEASSSGGKEKSKFFGKEAHLTVSGQLHAEVFASAFSKVYTFGPTFRAENSNTARHLAEFWMLEPEIAFAGMGDAMGSAHGVVSAVIEAVKRRCPAELEFFGKQTDGLMDKLERAQASEYPQVTYTEAVEALRRAEEGGLSFDGAASTAGSAVGVKWGDDLSSEQEKWLCSEFGGGAPVFVTRYPRALKPFYMLTEAPEPEEPGPVVGAFDLLAPGIGELAGGSAREHRLAELQGAMGEAGLLDARGSAGSLEWYVDLRRYGSVPHAGYGIGFERLVQFVTGLKNIREAIAVPRAPGTCHM
jgi:asparaginyl-tRNA synthetase